MYKMNEMYKYFPPSGEIALGLLPMVAQGRPWSLVEPDLMKEKEFLQECNKINSDKECPIKVFQLRDGRSLIWGYLWEETLRWYEECFNRVPTEIMNKYKGIWVPEESYKIAKRFHRAEKEKAANVAVHHGDIVGLFSIADENTMIHNFTGHPQWGISLVDLKIGSVKPLGVNRGWFEGHLGDITNILKCATVSEGGDCLVFEWV